MNSVRPALCHSTLAAPDPVPLGCRYPLAGAPHFTNGCEVTDRTEHWTAKGINEYLCLLPEAYGWVGHSYPRFFPPGTVLCDRNRHQNFRRPYLLLSNQLCPPLHDKIVHLDYWDEETRKTVQWAHLWFYSLFTGTKLQQKSHAKAFGITSLVKIQSLTSLKDYRLIYKSAWVHGQVESSEHSPHPTDLLRRINTGLVSFYMIQQHQASDFYRAKTQAPDRSYNTVVPSGCWHWHTASISTTCYHGQDYLCLSEAVLDFLDEEWGRRSFTGDGGNREDEGSCLWPEIEEKQLNGFLSLLLSESSDWLFGSCLTGEILSDSGRRQLQRAPTGKKYHFIIRTSRVSRAGRLGNGPRKWTKMWRGLG
jgi:hypothetical protein